MNFELDTTIPAITVFIQGILSFLSPCILPIIPLYMSYLSGGVISVNEDGSKNFDQKKVIVNTIFFIIGISFAFFILGLGFSSAGKFFTDHQVMFSKIGGILVIMLGLTQLGVFDKPFKGREFKLPIKINTLKMNPLVAFVMGFGFSFAWTPCVGPALSTVLIMISSAKSMTTGLILMAVYTLGFTIPFLLVGIFTTQCLNFFKKHRQVVEYTVKIGGVLMVLMGLMMFTGIMNNITGYLSSFDSNIDTSIEDNVDNETEDTTENTDTDKENETEESKEVMKAIDFKLKDQFGKTHKLSDYKGKTIFLNVWATWCPPCKKEMPDIQALYENYGYNEEEVVVLGVASPKSAQNTNTKEQDEQGVKNFLEENNYTYPVIMDTEGRLEREYGISSYPTTFMIDKDGNVFGYVPGMISYDVMESIVEQTKEGK